LSPSPPVVVLWTNSGRSWPGLGVDRQKKNKKIKKFLRKKYRRFKWTFLSFSFIFFSFFFFFLLTSFFYFHFVMFHSFFFPFIFFFLIVRFSDLYLIFFLFEVDDRVEHAGIADERVQLLSFLVLLGEAVVALVAPSAVVRVAPITLTPGRRLRMRATPSFMPSCTASTEALPSC